jgi:hypothetical protein
MAEVTKTEKLLLSQKLLDFQRSGLISYRNYLINQLDFASKSDNRKAYKQYIEKQLAMNDEKIKAIAAKLS